MLHRVTGSVAGKLAPGIEPLFLPRRVGVFEERFAEPVIDYPERPRERSERGSPESSGARLVVVCAERFP